MDIIATVTAPAVTIMALALACLVLAEILCQYHDRQNDLWRARVWWEGETYTHTAKSEQEGREWASCYPVDAHVSIEHVFHGRASFVAGRNVAL